MIQREILTRTATLNQTTEINIAREYCQHLFLSALYRQKGSERVMFKGGTALKIAYAAHAFQKTWIFPVLASASAKSRIGFWRFWERLP